MKITISLTDAETKGIKSYLKEVDGVDKPTKDDVKSFIDSLVQAIHSPTEAVSDHIRRFETKSTTA